MEDSPVSEWHHERRRSLLAQSPSPIREANEDVAFSALGASMSDLRTSDLVSDSTLLRAYIYLTYKHHLRVQ